MNECLYNCKSDKAVGYCKYHHCGVTAKQIKCKNCLKKECWHFVKYEDHPYWIQRKIQKQKRKNRKEQINRKVEGIYNNVV